MMNKVELAHVEYLQVSDIDGIYCGSDQEWYIEKAVSNHRAGYNCSQAVSCAFCGLVDMDEKLMLRIMESFGTEMGCMEGTCGAVSGAVCIASLLAAEGQNLRTKTYAMSRQIVQAFLEKNHSVTCKALKGIGTGKVLRDCRGCVSNVAAILAETLFQHGYLHHSDGGNVL